MNRKGPVESGWYLCYRHCPAETCCRYYSSDGLLYEAIPGKPVDAGLYFGFILLEEKHTDEDDR